MTPHPRPRCKRIVAAFCRLRAFIRRATARGARARPERSGEAGAHLEWAGADEGDPRAGSRSAAM